MKETVTMLNQQYVVPEGLQPYQGVTANSPWLASETEKRRRKICDSLEEAIRRSGLKNGMTISFHHAFRGGDKVVNMVMAKLAEMGFRDLTLASSSLIDAHWPLIEHIKNGVVRQIYTSGLRGKLGEEISAGSSLVSTCAVSTPLPAHRPLPSIPGRCVHLPAFPRR